MTLDCGCPPEYPDWDGQDIDLGGYRVHTLPIPTFFHMPLAFEAYLQRQQQAIDTLELEEPWPRLILTRTGLLRGSITRLLKDTTSMSRHVRNLPVPYPVRGMLHHGNVSMLAKPVREMQLALTEEGRIPKELYLCHLTCPRCSEDRGGDKILVLRHWRESPTLRRRVKQRATSRSGTA